MASMFSGSGVFSGSTAVLSSAGLFSRAFLLGLGLALRRTDIKDQYSMQKYHIKDKIKCIAHPGTVLRVGSCVAVDSPEDE